ncbi:MAG TPA: preprotein translocase subunit SecG [Caulobacteraceae bacterium]
MLQTLLLALNMAICVLLIVVVLSQRSEGGAFGTGGPTGLVTARGAGDLLTRTTWVLFSLFLTLSLALTLIGGHDRSSAAILQRLKNTSINPDQLVHPTPPPPTGAPATAPATAPAPLTLPPVTGAAPEQPRPRHHVAPVRRNAPTAAPAPTPNFGTPAPLALPPITGGSAPSGQQPAPQ